MAFNSRMNKKTDRMHHSNKNDRQHSFSGNKSSDSSSNSEDGRYVPPSGNRFGGARVGAGTGRSDDQRRTERFEERTGFGARSPRAYENRPTRTGRDFESNNDRPRFDRNERSERPTYGDRAERPSYGDRPSYSDRPRFGDRNTDRPRFADRQERSGPPEMFEVVCAKCGKDTTVPFRPTNGRPVLCRDCFRNNDSQSSDFERPRFEERAPREERSERSFDRPQQSFDRAPQREAFKPRPAKQQFAGKKSFGDKGQRFDNRNAEANWKGSTAFAEHPNIPGVFEHKGNLYTKNMVPGEVVYGERTFTWDGVEFRQWDPMRSKLGAGIKKGVVQTGITAGCKVLYLGCSTGTTVSHVSEIVGEEGIVYALDVAPRVMRDMVMLSKKRHNIYPIMFDANRPTTFSHAVPQVDTIFMDIAQSNQTEIFLKNVHAFLKPGGYALLSLKSRSVDITKTPEQLFTEARLALEKEMTVVDFKKLDPFEKDHALFVCKKK